VSSKNLAAIGDLFQPDVTFRDSGAPGGVVQGLENLKQFLAAVFVAFPDFSFSLDAVLNTTDDQVAWRGTVQGTMQGALQGIPATGKHFRVPIAELYRLVDGKIQETWIYFDQLNAMQQLGVLPVPSEVAG